MCRWFDSAPGHHFLSKANCSQLAFLFVGTLGDTTGPTLAAREVPEVGVSNMEEVPRVIIIAGPNGAGKTTFALEFLPREAACPVFVNADLIAAGIAPFAPEAVAMRAGRLMLEELSNHFAARTSFAFETTLSGRGYLRLIKEWQSAGYEVKIIFLQLASADEAIARVAQRVKQGGHHIPEAVIRRRFAAGVDNFMNLYAPRVDSWILYDNSGAAPTLIDWSDRL